MNWNQGTATGDLLWVLAVIAALWVLWLATGGALRPSATAGPFIEPPAPLGSGEIYSPASRGSRLTAPDSSNNTAAPKPFDPSRSVFSGQVKIRAGSARSETQSNREYIELFATRDLLAPLNITGWQLVNNPARRRRADVVLLPSAVKLFLRGTANQVPAPVLLTPDGRATIITGGPPASNHWPARVSFSVNKCVGYLAEGVAGFRLAPALPRACPAPRDEPNVDRLTNECYDYVRRLSVCHAPEFERRSDGAYLDDRPNTLPSACRAYLEDHFSYERCVAWHGADADFYTKDWRLYLNRSWELWAKDREVISLYDAQGRLVDELSY